MKRNHISMWVKEWIRQDVVKWLGGKKNYFKKKST